jgi:hypothetical protein
MNMWIYKGSSLQHLKQIWMEFMDFEVTVDFDNLFHCSIILMEKVCNLCVVLHCFLKILSEWPLVAVDGTSIKCYAKYLLF